MKTLWYCTLLALCAGCQTTSGPDSDVQDSLLAYVPESGQKDIERARQQRSEASEQLAIARRDANEAESLQDLAENDLEVTELRHDEAVDQANHEEKFGTQEEFEQAQKRRAEAQDAVRLARAKVRYYEDLGALAERRIGWMEARVDLADARYEFQKAQAVSELDRPAAQDIDVGAYREQVARLEDEVVRKAMEVQVAQRQAELQSEFVDATQGRVPENFRLNELAAVDNVFSSKLQANESDPLIREASFGGSGDNMEDQPSSPDGGR